MYNSDMAMMAKMSSLTLGASFYQFVPILLLFLERSITDIFEEYMYIIFYLHLIKYMRGIDEIPCILGAMNVVHSAM